MAAALPDLQEAVTGTEGSPVGDRSENSVMQDVSADDEAAVASSLLELQVQETTATGGEGEKSIKKAYELVVLEAVEYVQEVSDAKNASASSEKSVDSTVTENTVVLDVEQRDQGGNRESSMAKEDSESNEKFSESSKIVSVQIDIEASKGDNSEAKDKIVEMRKIASVKSDEKASGNSEAFMVKDLVSSEKSVETVAENVLVSDVEQHPEEKRESSKARESGESNEKISKSNKIASMERHEKDSDSGQEKLKQSPRVVVDNHNRSFQQNASKSTVSDKALVSCEKHQDSPKTGEASNLEDRSGSNESHLRSRKTVRIQSNEYVADNGQMKLKLSPSVSMNLGTFELSRSGGHQMAAEGTAMLEEAWEKLRKSYVYYKGIPVGTLAAMDPIAEALNYNQVFVRDFVPSGLACLMKSDKQGCEIVKNFLLKTLHLQGWEKRIDNFTLGEGVMPASFKVLYDSQRQKETLVADFGGSAIGRVAPVDSGFWWIILLRSYTKCTHDHALAERPEVQRGMKLILNLCLSDGFDTFPTLLCADGCSMIDRRMGIYGYPIEIQALFFFALRCARQMLRQERYGKELIERIDKRITALSYHIQKYYWLDFTQLNNIYRYKTEEYSHTAVNKFNVIPESIPDWVFDFMPLRGGYLIGNVSPARMDFRWFLVGNCIAILSCLATPEQATAIMDLIEERWEDLIGEMPLKIVYPALEGHEWRTVTGFDPKNTRWSYHNGGSWPVLLWLLTAASMKTGRPQIAKRAIELVEQRLSKDGWPEYYDGKTGRYVGKQARKYQTWSISGYLVAKLMIENPSNLMLISLEEDKKIARPGHTRASSY